MKTKVIYVLVSQETDYYYEMMLMSIRSLRLHHNVGASDVVVLTDNDTYQRLHREWFQDIVPLPTVVDIPQEYTTVQRSRYLKTNLRKLVTGDFLYLDIDTLICEPLDEIDGIQSDVAMVANGNNGLPLKKQSDIQLCKQAGFLHQEQQPYYNSGVIYSKDTPIATQLFDSWHSLWLQSLQNGVHQDQPALCQANIRLNYPIQELSTIWNCHLGGYQVLPEVKIVHYFGFNSLHRTMLFEQIRKVGVNCSLVDNIVQKPKTVGYSFFTLRDEAFAKYITSELLFVYETLPPLFRLLTFLSCLLRRPVYYMAKIKERLRKKYGKA